MAVTALIYILWGATIGVAAGTTIKALRTEHPLSSAKPVRGRTRYA